MDFRIADTFTDALARLPAQEQKAVKTSAFDLQLDPSSPGLSFHRIDSSKDPNFWSVRVNRDIRLIVHKTAESLLLAYVDHHDKAYAWAERRRIEAHPRTGAVQIVEARERVEETAPALFRPRPTAAPAGPSLFARLSADDLLSVGVPEDWVEPVRAASEARFFDPAAHLPAVLVVSKQLTSSYMPIAAVLFSDAIYRGVADGSDRLGTLRPRLHGVRPPRRHRGRHGEPRHHRGARPRGQRGRHGRAPAAPARPFADHPLVGEGRGAGLIAAVELVADKGTKARFDPPGKVGGWLYARAHDHGLIVRAVGDAICFCPPLIVTAAEVDEIVDLFGAVLDETAAWVAAGMP